MQKGLHDDHTCEPFHPLLQPRSSVFALGALFACSESNDSSLDGWDLEAVEAAEQEAASPLTSEEHEAWLDAQFADTLSAEERSLLEEALRESDDSTGITIVGRMVLFGDVYLDAGPILQQLRSEREGVAKGRTLNAADQRTGPGNLPVAPTVYSSNVNGNYLFHRPDTSGSRIVVPNGAANDFLVPALQQAADAVAAAADDCLQSIPVIRQSDFDALSFQDRNVLKPIFVRRGAQATVCPGATGALACALFPRDETRDFDINVSSTRLVPGRHMGLVDTQITSADPKVWTLTHELLHTLGLAHPNDTLSPHAVVSGSSCSRSVSSIMTRLGRPTDVITADDRTTIDILYSPPPGSSCVYRRGLRVIGPTVNSCP